MNLNSAHLQKIHYDESLIQFVDDLILHAFQQKVSDIHLEAHENFCRVRYRQNGILLLANEIDRKSVV